MTPPASLLGPLLGSKKPLPGEEIRDLATQPPGAGVQAAAGAPGRRAGMALRPLGRTGLAIAPLVLGGNVFGWTVDDPTGFDLLDGFLDAGFNAIDTADIYSVWADGNRGGESEALIGRWLRANPGKRERLLLFSKVGGDFRDGRKGLSKRWITQAVEDSLRRLRTDRIDLYQAHWPDPATPLAETLEAYARLIQDGKVRAIGCSNLDAAGLVRSLRVARAQGLPSYQTLQCQYHLCARREFEADLGPLALREGIGVLTYSGLARGFLTGKYRSRADLAGSPRGKDVARYLDRRGRRILGALDLVAERHRATPAAVALAWLMVRNEVTAPIASVTNRQQLASLVLAPQLVLADEDVRILDQASDGWCEQVGLGPSRRWLGGAWRQLRAGRDR